VILQDSKDERRLAYADLLNCFIIKKKKINVISEIRGILCWTKSYAGNKGLKQPV
jgi:hypothetical protein